MVTKQNGVIFNLFTYLIIFYVYNNCFLTNIYILISTEVFSIILIFKRKNYVQYMIVLTQPIYRIEVMNIQKGNGWFPQFTESLRCKKDIFMIRLLFSLTIIFKLNKFLKNQYKVYMCKRRIYINIWSVITQAIGGRNHTNVFTFLWHMCFVFSM